MRNARYPDDPALLWSQNKRDQCQLRLVIKGCKEGRGWGCAMLGQAYRFSGGTKQDEKKAIKSFSRVCTANEPKHPSCLFAKEHLKALKDDRS